ncbi:unnamed protein product [Bubo scandiacus]
MLMSARDSLGNYFKRSREKYLEKHELIKNRQCGYGLIKEFPKRHLLSVVKAIRLFKALLSHPKFEAVTHLMSV